MRKLIILSLAIFAVSCSRSYKEPIDAASSVAPSEISIGGVIAELKDSTQIPNNGNLNNQSDYQLRIKKLMTQAEAFKNKRKPMEQQAFQSEWKELNKQFMIHQEELSSEDVHVWMTLNDSLLLYSEDVAYADALERLVYNNLGKYAFTDKQLKSFVYTRRYDRIYLNLYGSSSMQYEHTTGGSIRLVQSTDYPFDGRITLKVELQDKRFLDLFVRIPAWASYASVTVKGVKYPVTPGKYSEVARMWKNG
ncbi:MAG TPA: hypothetical protein VKA27_07125, partial [Sunxiuqinia sp.]|nr:hypothetical protein [Sunxiuqinia sp.]